MKTKTVYILLIFLTVFACVTPSPVYAQDLELTGAEKKYYNDKPEKLLPDAKAAFKKSDYIQVQRLCRFHSFVIGDEQISERTKLWDDARICFELSQDMATLQKEGKIKEAKVKAGEILKLNPDDHAAQSVWNMSAPATKPKPKPNPVRPAAPGTYGTINGHQWIDLGLSVKWATTNVGADTITDSGDYFAWGETKPKAMYALSNLKYHEIAADSNWDRVIKYNTKKNCGPVDRITRLEPEDDVAYANWGKGWRMPTKAEFDELKRKCVWQWINNDGQYGYLVTSKTNGNNIFLPVAGYKDSTDHYYDGVGGYYWTSDLNTNGPLDAWQLFFDSSKSSFFYCCRGYGLSVRPVTE